MDPKLPTQINYDDELQARDMKIAKLLKKIDELKDEVEGLKEDLAAYECTDTEETEETTRTDEATMSGVNNGKQQMYYYDQIILKTKSIIINHQQRQNLSLRWY